MPASRGLKIIKRKGSEFWYVRGTVRGQAVFESTGTTDEDSARAYCALREAELWKQSVFGRRATATFASAVNSFIAANKVSVGDSKLLKKLLLHFGETRLDKINQAELDRAYQVLLPPNASNANKLRTVLAPLRSVLNHAARRDWCDAPKFEVPEQNPSRIAFMRPAEAVALMQNAAPHLRPLIAFCLFTGARVSEALELQWAQVDLFGSRVTFLESKNGRDRHYDMPAAAVAALSSLPAANRREGHVFMVPAVINKHGRVVSEPHPYHNNGRQAGGQIKKGWAGACRRAALTGFTPHDMRHTWASWHYCLHKDLLLLRDEGGWQSVDQVEIYAHKMPAAYRPQIEAILGGSPTSTSRKAV